MGGRWPGEVRQGRPWRASPVPSCSWAGPPARLQAAHPRYRPPVCLSGLYLRRIRQVGGGIPTQVGGGAPACA